MNYEINPGDLVVFEYTNNKGVWAKKRAIVKRFIFGSNEHHSEPQLLLVAFDVDKLKMQTFAAKGINKIVKRFTEESMERQ